MSSTAQVEPVPGEYQLSVEEAIREAMNAPQGHESNSRSSDTGVGATTHLPPPHLPLRKASARKLRSRHEHAPKPYYAPTSRNGVRGFNPSPVRPEPHIAAVTASTEHAFAARDMRRPSKLPLGSVVLRQGQHDQDHHDERPSSSLTATTDSEMPPVSPLLPPLPSSPQQKAKGIRGSRSLGEGLKGLRHRLSSSRGGAARDGRDTPDSGVARPSIGTDGIRQSFRSAFTSHSSYLNASSVNTDCSSWTGNSSHSEFVNVYPHWPDTEEGSVTNEDVIGMYADGFESAKQSMDTYGKRSVQVERSKLSMDTMGKPSFQAERPNSVQEQRKQKRPPAHHRRSKSASLLLAAKSSSEPTLRAPEIRQETTAATADGNSSTRINGITQSNTDSAIPAPEIVPRDRYGFKKATHYVTVDQYDAWDVRYSTHLARRSRKWHALMKAYGLSTDKPYRFPPKSEKIKRYVRKGIPPEFRGAAWFWYAHGPAKQKQAPGLYGSLLEQIENGKLSENDREHIERDLNRTFPDNVRFKPDPIATSDLQADAGGGQHMKNDRTFVEPETPVVQALRRVLQAFAIHNPGIGYCQSLNFIAGLLLLFLDEDEEKAFILLEIVTSEHLPGTHGVALEGANIDIAVLMSCIRDTMPAIWEKLDDKGGGILAGDPAAQTLRLPTVSLATTAWFMSLFVGTLPIESVLRVWDCLFFEGSKTLFRVALAIFKAGGPQIQSVSDPMEIFQVVQTIPRRMLDVNSLMECAFGRAGAGSMGRRRGGFGVVSQRDVDRMREERRRDVKMGIRAVDGDIAEAGVVERWRGRWRRGTKA